MLGLFYCSEESITVQNINKIQDTILKTNKTQNITTQKNIEGVWQSYFIDGIKKSEKSKDIFILIFDNKIKIIWGCDSFVCDSLVQDIEYKYQTIYKMSNKGAELSMNGKDKMIYYASGYKNKSDGNIIYLKRL
ncbi:MAG: hypothetical protein EAZ85_07465 [Bacteroidetes bacterium]|nr:MAG: hypothetical protein EAZ85_07465 [Bacteroidota bacterium]TAG88331.1 MAG: hypothetical protein EAZ20_08750 [Bacteroidota bacterium]